MGNRTDPTADMQPARKLSWGFNIQTFEVHAQDFYPSRVSMRFSLPVCFLLKASLQAVRIAFILTRGSSFWRSIIFCSSQAQPTVRVGPYIFVDLDIDTDGNC